ncbi:hypothetical protein [Xenorhabdus entomophaga]|uniref:hypothetical protein n=1 Tax=Xenorhabdus entomophaga TaxID=3136257 RepID=UPI0030F385E2
MKNDMKYVIDSIGSYGHSMPYGYPDPGYYIVQNNQIVIELSAYMDGDSRAEKCFSFKVTLENVFDLSLNEIREKAVEIAKEQFKAASSQI